MEFLSRLLGIGGGSKPETAAPTQQQETSAATPPAATPASLKAHHVITRPQAEALAQPQSTPAVAPQPAPSAPITQSTAQQTTPQVIINKIQELLGQLSQMLSGKPQAAQDPDINGLLAAFEAAAKDASAQGAATTPQAQPATSTNAKQENPEDMLKALEALAGMFGEPAKAGTTPPPTATLAPQQPAAAPTPAATTAASKSVA